MNSSASVKAGYLIFLDEEYQQFIDQTYEPFLKLARHFAPAIDYLTDDQIASKLQDLYFLLKSGLLKISPIHSSLQTASLFLEILPPSQKLQK